MPIQSSILNAIFDTTLALYRVADKIFDDNFFKKKLRRCGLEILILVQAVFSGDNFDQNAHFALEKKIDDILLLLKFGKSYYHLVNPLNFSILINSYESLQPEIYQSLASVEKATKARFVKNTENESDQPTKDFMEKDEFVYLASHQLRTPLSAISWYAEMLLSEDAGNINQQQKKYLEEVYNNSQKMSQLINTLLNISRIESGCFAVEIKPLNFSVILDDVLLELDHEISNKKITIEKIYNPTPTVKADYHLAYVIFQNLISNSIKYTPEGGEIKIEVNFLKNEKEINLKIKECVLIKISDNGYGIPKNQQEKVFTKLFRGDNIKNKDSAGFGIGLYTVKLMSDRCGFKIWFESEEDSGLSASRHGTTFYIAIPLEGMKEKERLEDKKDERG